MPNCIVGLKYQPICGISIEEGLLDVFADLRGYFERFSQNFEIKNGAGPIKDFKSFLELALKENSAVTLTGSGDIGGLVVKDASLEYDLSQVHKAAQYWDQQRDGSCHSCLQYYRYSFCQDESISKCKINGDHLQWRNCSDYDARIKNAKGEPARPLAELIVEAAR